MTSLGFSFLVRLRGRTPNRGLGRTSEIKGLPCNEESDIEAINITEDREKFRELMMKIGVGVPPQASATSFLEGKEIIIS